MKFPHCFITLDLLIPDWCLLLDRDSGDWGERQGIQSTFKVIIKVHGFMVQVKKGKMQVVWSDVLEEEIEMTFLKVVDINIK